MRRSYHFKRRPYRAFLLLTAATILCLGALGVSPRSPLLPLPANTDANGNVTLTWDGTLAELFAADAYAECAVASADDAGATNVTPGSDTDYELKRLKGKMESAAGISVSASIERDWLEQRTAYPEYNADPYTLAPGTISISEHDPNTPYSSFGTVSLAEFKGWGVFFDSDPRGSGTITEAGREVRYAQVNLCMALKLRAKLETANVFLATPEEHAQLLGIIHGRAKLAVAYYSLMAKVIGSREPRSFGASAAKPISSGQWLHLFRIWADHATSESLAELGGDFHSAVALEIAAATDYARELQRQASARKNGRTLASRAESDFGLGSPRLRLLNLLYGGDPLGPTDAKLDHAPGGARMDGTGVPYVSASMSDPRVLLLLNLARAHDALRLRLTQSTSGGAIDREASASRLYVAVETALRMTACELATPGTCVPSEIEATVLGAENTKRTELSKLYQIQRKHADALIGALADVIEPLFSQAAPSDRLFEGPFQIDGQLTTVSDPSGTWAHLDSDFSFAQFMPRELATGFQSLKYLMSEPVFDAVAYKQGFINQQGNPDVANRVNNSTDFKLLSPMGTIPTLTYAREAILAGAPVATVPNLTADVYAFFQHAARALPAIEAAVGTTTGVLRPLISRDCGASSDWCNQTAGGKAGYTFDLVALEGSPYTSVAVAPYARYLTSVANAPNANILGVSRAQLDGLTSSLPTQTAQLQGFGVGRERRTFTVYGSPPDALATSGSLFTRPPNSAPADILFLKAPGASASETQYTTVFRLGLNYQQAYYFSEGGSLNTIAEKAWEVLPNDWSTPANDALGNRADQIAPTDATLVGGAPGEEVYQYYLKRAREAATDATAAVKTAIDLLTTAGLSEAETKAQEARNSGLAANQLQLLCGPFSDCSLPGASYVRTFDGGVKDALCKDALAANPVLDQRIPDPNAPPVDPNAPPAAPIEVTLASIAQKKCEDLVDSLASIVPPLNVPRAVLVLPDAPVVAGEAIISGQVASLPPTIEGAEGTELQLRVTAAWSSVSTLHNAIDAASKLAASFATEVALTRNDLVLAEKRRNDAVTAIDRVLNCNLNAPPPPDGSSRLTSQSCDAAFTCGSNVNPYQTELRTLCGAEVQLENDYSFVDKNFHRWCDDPGQRKQDATDYSLADYNLTQTVYTSHYNPQDQADCLCRKWDRLEDIKYQVAARERQLKANVGCKSESNGYRKCASEGEWVKGNCSKCPFTKPPPPKPCKYPKPPPGGTNEDPNDGSDEYGRWAAGVEQSAANQPSNQTVTDGEENGKSETLDTTVDKAKCDGISTLPHTVNARLELQTPFPELVRQGHCDVATGEKERQDDDPSGDPGQKAIDLANIKRQEEFLLALVGADNVRLANEKEQAIANYDAQVTRLGRVSNEVNARFTAQLTQVQNAIGAVNKASASLAQLEQEARSVTQQSELENALITAQAQAKSGLSTVFQNHDIWRARALLANARQLSIAARRAIESRFVVDLSNMQEAQAYVAAPALWADDIYDSDLSAPAVVGLDISPKIKGAVYPNKLTDYVTNLERFVQGYSASYPTSQVKGDTEVVSLPAPDTRASTTSAAGDELKYLAPEASGWSFTCPQSNTPMITHPLGVGSNATMDTACLNRDGTRSKPATAIYAFHLDPWGRVNGNWASPPYSQRYNIRWQRLALNLVGTGVRDCSRAQGSEGCSVRYALRHSGPALISDFNGDWRSQSIPDATIEGGRALAVEEIVDPVTRGFTDPLVANVARTEFRGRPLHGTYELILYLDEGVTLSQLEHLQLLIQSDYWVAQNRPNEQVHEAIEPLFSPKDLGTKLAMWLSPDKDFTLVDGRYSEVGDLSSNGNKALQADPLKRPERRLGADGFGSFIFSGAQRLDVPDSTSLSWRERGGYAFWYRQAPEDRDRLCCGYLLASDSAGNRSIIRSGYSTSMVWNLRPDGEIGTAGVDPNWHFWVFQFDGSRPPNERALIYRDGVRTTTNSSGSAPVTLVDPSSALAIGNGDTPNAGLMGDLGNIYVFGETLTAREIAQLYAFERRR
ncbi:MAG: hypothetical protein SFV15_17510 [Polyangiaceae bacterium]|nr:hypothetical protein [Polyangiaceae bacterium]